MYLDELIKQRQGLLEILALSADLMAGIDKMIEIVKSQELEDSLIHAEEAAKT